ncbi:PD40 domain-containing protein [Aliikangiella sp. G2MR2-5]|uniref:TolB family protein n=1 Tax=Aliikangiella sp. G2MR2-5 TaxID=2788943 RepID=UPI0018AA13C9|nr:PD40 domain-containing protein [Aliikangiella sp. G2MR2-5]
MVLKVRNGKTTRIRRAIYKALFCSSIILTTTNVMAIEGDQDNDGMPDEWELVNGLNPMDPSDASTDLDWDTLSNLTEYGLGTDPNNFDSDSDELDDGMEVSLNIDPTKPDSDGDQLPDGWEYFNSLNPADASDASLDADFDGLNNLEEYLLGSFPQDPDTDDDSILDGDEEMNGTSALDYDTDNDGLSDNEASEFGTNQLNRDSDSDGIIDGFQFGSVLPLDPLQELNSGTGESSGAALSADGRFAVFVSERSGLVSNDNNNFIDVFWHDTLTGEVRKISNAWDGGDANGWSGRIVNGIGIDISADGRYVVFQSGASNIIPSDLNGGSSDIYLHDTQTGKTSLVSVTSDGVQASGSSWSPRISNDGRKIVFRSSATELLPGADNNSYNSDIFLHDLDTGVTELISKNSQGVQGNGNSEGADISSDGRYVSFLSKSDNLVIDDNNSPTLSKNDLFVHDRVEGKTARVNLNNDGTEFPTEYTYGGSLSGDGRFIAFSTTADIDNADSNNGFDCYIRDLQSGNNILVSAGESNIKCVTPSLSESGRFVAYELLRGASNSGDGIYLKDMQSGQVKVISKTEQAAESFSYGRGIGLDVSDDGQFVQYALRPYYLGGTIYAGHQNFLSKTDMPKEVKGPKLTTDFLSNVSSSEWTTVTLPHHYQSMVVVATPQYDQNSVPMVVRIRNSEGNQFEIKLDRTDGLSAEVFGDVHYFVVEEGVYTVENDGLKMEAVKFTSSVTDSKSFWSGEARSYQNNYQAPVVLGQVMTANDPAFSVFWSYGASRGAAANASFLNVGKHVGEDPDIQRQDETIGYVVFEQGAGSVNGLNYIARLGGDTIRGVQNGLYNYSLSGLTNPKSAVCSQAAMDGGNGGWAVLLGEINADRLTLGIDEDRMKDSERNHTTEQVGYIVFENAEN